MYVRRNMVMMLIAVLAGCARATPLAIPELPKDHTPGTLQRVEHIASYGAPTFRVLLGLSNLRRDMPVQSGADLYRLHYWTTNFDGTATSVSGLVAIPRRGEIRGVVSYQHGTQSERRKAPSKPTAEGVLVSAVFAGGGYLLAAPDYIGLGASRELHPYIHAATEAGAAVDLLKAAETFVRRLSKKWPPSVYLVGFSQGGHATMATHRALESLNDPRLHVVASASVSGVYDLANLTFPTLLEGKSGGDSLYLAYLSLAYSTIYGQPLSDIIAAPYDARLPALFDGTHSLEGIVSALPSKPRELLSPEFLDAYDNGRPTWFMTALGENEVFQWTPNAPVRVYYGEDDVDVSPEEAETLVEEFTRRGADVRLISVGDFDHGGSVLEGVPRVRAWFDEVSKSISHLEMGVTRASRGYGRGLMRCRNPSPIWKWELRSHSALDGLGLTAQRFFEVERWQCGCQGDDFARAVRQ